MKVSNTLVPAALLGLAAAAPTQTAPTKTKRSTTECAQYASTTTGAYVVYNDLWDESAATSGSQCYTINSLSDGVLDWSTSWSWEGSADDVKSYANVVATLSEVQLSTIEDLTTTWDWSYSGTDTVADVSYDMFLSSTSGGDADYEVMVWMAAIGGAGPISSTYSSDGDADPIASPTISGIEFNLYKGPNGDTTVYSFVAKTEQTSFSGNLMDWFDYLIDNEGISSSQYLISAGAGTEAFTGSDCVFSVSKYSMTMTT